MLHDPDDLLCKLPSQPLRLRKAPVPPESVGCGVSGTPLEEEGDGPFEGILHLGHGDPWVISAQEGVVGVQHRGMAG